DLTFFTAATTLTAGPPSGDLTHAPVSDSAFQAFANQPGNGVVVAPPGVPIGINQVVQTTFNLSGAADVPFSFSLRLTGQAGASVDLFDTAQLSFNLPPGVSVTTDGGFASAVPEPTSLPLVALGGTLLVLLTVRRRVKRRRA